MKDELVSVIIPVYNVYDYLNECVQALINQSYKNLDIILVDDGSTDDSGLLCDEIKRQDERIQVVHKKNGGLSSARNVGIELAKGNIISFIDSDDYPRSTMIQKLIECMDKYDADIVCCDYSSDNVKQKNQETVDQYTSTEAITLLLDNGGFRCFAWNKLYKKELFFGVEYPEGELFEDIKTTYTLFKKAKKICYLRDDLYYYRLRESSITSAKFTHRNRDLVKAIDTLVNDAKNCLNSAEYNRLIPGYVFYYICFAKKAMLADAEISDDIKNIRKCIRKNVFNILKSDGMGKKVKIEIFLIGISPSMFKKILKMKNNIK